MRDALLRAHKNAVSGMVSLSGLITRHFHEKAGPSQGVFLVVPTMLPTADQREAQLAFGLSFLERFFLRPSIRPIADQREAHNAAIPGILKSPTRPTSIRTLCGAMAPVPAGCPQLETGAAVSEPN
jgi:hypothetical protein